MTIPASASIYLHIPFCGVKCTYCAFNTYTNLGSLIEPFVQALIKEVHVVGLSNPGMPVHTVYFGGGTPSLLSKCQISRILEALKESFDVQQGAEISMECNPDDVTKEYVEGVLHCGVNRLSIGMQSANQNELELFARRHDNDAVVKAVMDARAAGCRNLNLDLIYGTPHQTMADWENSLRQMIHLNPEHVSLYALGLEEGTPMMKWVTNGQLPMPDDDLAADMYELASSLLEDVGLFQYEISNWAKGGYECRHNLQYWRNLPYPGLGPGAHGFAASIRYSVVLAPQRYIQLMKQDQHTYEFPLTPAVDQSHRVDRETEIADTLLMGLRLTREGIDRKVFYARFGEDIAELKSTLIVKFVDAGLLELFPDRLRLTARGRLLSNVIFRELV